MLAGTAAQPGLVHSHTPVRFEETEIDPWENRLGEGIDLEEIVAVGIASAFGQIPGSVG